jgi:hypothetical protein
MLAIKQRRDGGRAIVGRRLDDGELGCDRRLAEFEDEDVDGAPAAEPDGTGHLVGDAVGPDSRGRPSEHCLGFLYHRALDTPAGD